MSEVTYYKTRIVPFDIGTTVCWWEDTEGRSGDILCEDIPDNANLVVLDSANNIQRSSRCME